MGHETEKHREPVGAGVLRTPPPPPRGEPLHEKDMRLTIRQGWLKARLLDATLFFEKLKRKTEIWKKL